MNNPCTQYAEDVVGGKILACKWVVLACKRHLSDLKRKDIYFHEESAMQALKFFSFVRHSKGEWAGQMFELGPWQKFIVACIS